MPRDHKSSSGAYKSEMQPYHQKMHAMVMPNSTDIQSSALCSAALYFAGNPYPSQHSESPTETMHVSFSRRSAAADMLQMAARPLSLSAVPQDSSLDAAPDMPLRKRSNLNIPDQPLQNLDMPTPSANFEWQLQGGTAPSSNALPGIPRRKWSDINLSTSAAAKQNSPTSVYQHHLAHPLPRSYNDYRPFMPARQGSVPHGLTVKETDFFEESGSGDL